MAKKRINHHDLRHLDSRLRHGESVFEDFTDIEAEKEMNDSGIIASSDLHPETPEEEVLNQYNGLTTQDPGYWR